MRLWERVLILAWTERSTKTPGVADAETAWAGRGRTRGAADPGAGRFGGEGMEARRRARLASRGGAELRGGEPDRQPVPSPSPPPRLGGGRGGEGSRAQKRLGAVAHHAGRRGGAGGGGKARRSPRPAAEARSRGRPGHLRQRQRLGLSRVPQHPPPAMGSLERSGLGIPKALPYLGLRERHADPRRPRPRGTGGRTAENGTRKVIWYRSTRRGSATRLLERKDGGDWVQVRLPAREEDG